MLEAYQKTFPHTVVDLFLIRRLFSYSHRKFILAFVSRFKSQSAVGKQDLLPGLLIGYTNIRQLWYLCESILWAGCQFENNCIETEGLVYGKPWVITFDLSRRFYFKVASEVACDAGPKKFHAGPLPAFLRAPLQRHIGARVSTVYLFRKQLNVVILNLR